MTTVTRTITVAAGVFAPGHLGELTRYLPFELVDEVLARTKTVQRRIRDLPSRVGVYFVLALAMFPEIGYCRVWAKLIAGLAGLPVPHPSEKALRCLRRRLAGAGAGVVRDGCWAVGQTIHAGNLFRRAAHGRLRRIEFGEDSRYRP